MIICEKVLSVHVRKEPVYYYSQKRPDFNCTSEVDHKALFE